MKENFLQYLACPECQSEISIKKIDKKENDKIKSGELFCAKCNSVYPIINFIPRFVPVENYASNFGLEWTRHAKTQYDNHSGKSVSKIRFFEETKWPENLEGEIILEVGSGSGRFTEQAATTKAMVVSMDYSFAVEANYKSNGHNENVFIVQGSIFSMPFKRNFFDKLFCIGVIQHTPDPKLAFMSLPEFLKNNGKLVVDVYKKVWTTIIDSKYWVRPFTKNKDPKKLYDFVENYVNFMWPVARLLSKIPVMGRHLSWALLIPDYTKYGFDSKMLKEWAVLDSYDMLSPQYDSPQTLSTVKKWFHEANLSDIDVHFGYNGIEGRGTVKK